MIQSAMMFALGFFVSGLIWLALAVALVRRARRMTERRLLASISTRRAEFETERDELRARHAVQMYRQEREVSRVLDMATAHRLEADVKEHDLVSARAELAAREEDFQELQARLAAEQALTQDLERRHAEAGSALRSVQHALQVEIRRRALAEEALETAGILGRVRRSEQGVSDGADDSGFPGAQDLALARDGGKGPQRLPAASPAEAPEAPIGGSVVPLPTRPRPAAAAEAAESAPPAAEAARDLQRLAGEAHGDLGKTVWRVPATAEPRVPAATTPAEPTVAELVAHRMASAPLGQAVDRDADPQDSETPESRFFEALAEIRAIRRASGQAGE